MEDNPADILLIRLALERQNLPASLVVMQDGERGLDFIELVERGEADPPDIFVLDLSLPRRSGPELLDRIKASRLCSRAKVLIASSSRSPTDKQAAAEHGADFYFVKPFSYNEFMAIGTVVSELLSS